jgi:hypothetical protein
VRVRRVRPTPWLIAEADMAPAFGFDRQHLCFGLIGRPPTGGDDRTIAGPITRAWLALVAFERSATEQGEVVPCR